MSALAPSHNGWRRLGRRVGRRFRKVSPVEWQARGLGWLEGAGMLASPIVAIVVLHAFDGERGSSLVAVAAALFVAWVTSSVAHECYPELKSERRERLDRAYVKRYRKGVSDQRRMYEAFDLIHPVFGGRP